ncbi:MAG: hypothetical protein GX654_03135 [Desulfatiglans sp.]|nr:hypothetical protein [Desulfatiglans sp.]
MADIEVSNGMRTELKAVGSKNIPGRFAYSIATGMAKYGSDCALPDILHAEFIRSLFGHVKIKNIDITLARESDGIVDIVTWDDPDVLAANPALFKPPVMTMAGIHVRWEVLIKNRFQRSA